MKEYIAPPLVEILKTQIEGIECPHGCEQKTITVKLTNRDLKVYCNSCGFLLYDSSQKELKDLLTTG